MIGLIKIDNSLPSPPINIINSFTNPSIPSVGSVRPSNVPVKVPSSLTITSTQIIPEGTQSVHGTSHKINSVVDVSKIISSDITILDSDIVDDLNDNNTGKTGLNSCNTPEFLIVILCEGIYDTSTVPVFNETALILSKSLKSLNYKSYIRTCQDLRYCKIESDRFVILLGIHHLPRYTDSNDNIASIISDFPKKDRTVIYNFEDTMEQIDFKNDGMKNVMEYYEYLWDYSYGNYLKLKENGFNNVQYVPLGYVDDLYDEDDDDIDVYVKYDVLFYGRLNNYRKSVIEKLRDEGISVRHLNAGGDGIWGEELREGEE